MDEPVSISPSMQDAIERAKAADGVYRPDEFNSLPNPAPIANWPFVQIPVKPAADPVKRPAHYTRGEVEVIDYIEQVVKDYPPEVAYHIGNVLKYLSRAPHKGATQQDLEKAEWYLRRAINRVAQKR